MYGREDLNMIKSMQKLKRKFNRVQEYNTLKDNASILYAEMILLVPIGGE
jgi:hypothetical protein